MNRLINKGSDVLSNPCVLYFGLECLGITLWMLCIMITRYIFYWLCLDRILPCGFIFASPILLYVLKVIRHYIVYIYVYIYVYLLIY